MLCPKQWAAEWGGFIAGFFLRWTSPSEGMAQWVLVDTRREKKQVTVAGKFHGCIQKLALVVPGVSNLQPRMAMSVTQHKNHKFT